MIVRFHALVHIEHCSLLLFCTFFYIFCVSFWFNLHLGRHSDESHKTFNTFSTSKSTTNHQNICCTILVYFCWIFPCLYKMINRQWKSFIMKFGTEINAVKILVRKSLNSFSYGCYEGALWLANAPRAPPGFQQMQLRSSFSMYMTYCITPNWWFRHQSQIGMHFRVVFSKMLNWQR